MAATCRLGEKYARAQRGCFWPIPTAVPWAVLSWAGFTDRPAVRPVGNFLSPAFAIAGERPEGTAV
jgi:hypothetical protein